VAKPAKPAEAGADGGAAEPVAASGTAVRPISAVAGGGRAIGRRRHPDRGLSAAIVA
jgi:hypothetical protein